MKIKKLQMEFTNWSRCSRPLGLL